MNLMSGFFDLIITLSLIFSRLLFSSTLLSEPPYTLLLSHRNYEPPALRSEIFIDELSICSYTPLWRCQCMALDVIELHHLIIWCGGDVGPHHGTIDDSTACTSSRSGCEPYALLGLVVLLCELRKIFY